MATGIKSLLVAASISMAAIVSPAMAGEEDKGFYLKAGYGFTNIDSADNCDYTSTPCTVGTYYLKDDNNSWDLGLGYDWGNSIRSEFTYQKSNYKLKEYAGTNNTRYAATGDTDVEVTSYDFGLYYDFEQLGLGNFTPYAGIVYGLSTGDVGTHTVDSTTVTGGDDDVNKMVYTLGLTYEVTNNVDVYGEASYIDYENSRIKDNDYKNLEGVGATFGLRYRF